MHVYRVARTMKTWSGGWGAMCMPFNSGHWGRGRHHSSVLEEEEMTHSDYKMVVMSIAPRISP